MDEITLVLYWSSVHRAAYRVSRPFGVLELASAVSGGTETGGDLSVNSALTIPPPLSPLTLFPSCARQSFPAKKSLN